MYDTIQSIQVCVPQDGGGNIPGDEPESVAPEDGAERRHGLRPLRFSSGATWLIGLANICPC